MVAVHRAASLVEAHSARGALGAAGIRAEVRGEHLSAAAGVRPPEVELRPVVMVAAADADRARHLLAVRSQAPVAGAAPTSDGPDGGAVAHRAMCGLFVAAGDLRRDPRRGDRRDDVRRLSAVIATVAAPFGVADATWSRATDLAGALTAEPELGAEDAVRSAAAALHDLLRPLV